MLNKTKLNWIYFDDDFMTQLGVRTQNENEPEVEFEQLNFSRHNFLEVLLIEW